MASSAPLTKNDEIKLQILSVYPKFVTDVDPDRLSDYLVQENVITIDQWQRIHQENRARTDKCRALLSHLFFTQHPEAFLGVPKALKKENHYLRKYIGCQESACETSVQPEKQAALNENMKIQQLEKDNEDLRRALAAEKDLLLKMQKDHVDQKRAWNAEKDRLLKIQDELKGKLHPGEIRYISNPVVVQTIRTRAVEEENKEIGGLAILDKELFVVSEETSEVEVFDLLKLSFIRRWKLKELSGPQDIGSCKRSKCLYIPDKGTGQSNQILRVSPSGKLIKKWSTGDDTGFGMSVTDESNVILTVNSKNKLNEYSPDGRLIRAINLSSVEGILYPWLAIKLTNGHFLVSHGHVAGEPHRVCVVDAEGNLEKSFGGKPGSTIQNMRQPVNMAIDENGFVMVVDRGNSRVLLLDSDLQFKREILSKERHGLRDPLGIYLDETNRRLFVVDINFKPENKLLKLAPIAVFDF